MDIHLGIDERYADQIVVLQLPDVDLLAHGRHQEPDDVRDGSYRAFLLFGVDHFDLVLGQRFARFRDDVDDVEQEYPPSARYVLRITVIRTHRDVTLETATSAFVRQGDVL